MRREPGADRRNLLLDAVTVVLLVAALLLPWDSVHRGFEDVPLRVAAFMAALSVLVPHAVRWDGLPLPWPMVSPTRTLLVGATLAMLVLGRDAVAFAGRATTPARPGSPSSGSPCCSRRWRTAVQPRRGERHPVTCRGWGVASARCSAGPPCSPSR